MTNPKLPADLLPMEPPKTGTVTGASVYSLLVRDPRSMVTEFLMITVHPNTTPAAIVEDLERVSLTVLHMIPLPVPVIPETAQSGVN